MALRAFLCHQSKDSAFVIQVAKHLKRSLAGVFYFEDYQRADVHFAATVNRELVECNVMVIFIGSNFSNWQSTEINTALALHNKGEIRKFVVIPLCGATGTNYGIPPQVSAIGGFTQIVPETIDAAGAARLSAKILLVLDRPWLSADDLPLEPHLFSYEKDIIQFFNLMNQFRESIHQQALDQPDIFASVREKILNGCPTHWPKITRWKRNPPIANKLDPDDVGQWRPESASVLTAALRDINNADHGAPEKDAGDELLTFHEAGPRRTLYFPKPGNDLRVAILVSGGIAPGINAVIDGIVQRHWKYAEWHGYSPRLKIYGLQNGFRAFENLSESHRFLVADSHQAYGQSNRLETPHHIHEAGSILGTSRVEELIEEGVRLEEIEDIVNDLRAWEIDILYVIGGDGSMRAAHAIWSIAQSKDSQKLRSKRPLSVIAIPKTMDNDILWVWQSFGFLSAVEKAREFIEHLSMEVNSNPRVCVAQLFGSDSGFVVSHAVLASATGHCALALIPEVEFSMRHVASYLKERISQNGQQKGQRIPFGLVVMAETAIPIDAMDFVGEPGAEPLIDIQLSDIEKEEIRKFHNLRQEKQRIQGHASDELRTAGLKIVSRGLQKLLPDPSIRENLDGLMDWDKLRVFTNEPRHLLRAIPPSSSDIIIGHRLGTLAVDNALAGYTDLMVSQWLTEYVLVPLKLVVLGRKRIRQSGIFWKSVLSKTGQPSDLR